jgi:hypothetical protein
MKHRTTVVYTDGEVGTHLSNQRPSIKTIGDGHFLMIELKDEPGHEPVEMLFLSSHNIFSVGVKEVSE